jgi:protein-disulfide isomerase
MADKVSEQKSSKSTKKNYSRLSDKKPARTKTKGEVKTKEPVTTKPQDNENITYGQFRNSYKTLTTLIGLLSVLAIFNLGLVFFLAWAVGHQLDESVQDSHGERLFLVEEKADAIIDALPEQIRPKLDLEVEKPSLEQDRWKGDKENRYVWIKYSDLECPYCSAIQPELDEFIEGNSDASLIFRNLPLTNIHENAQRLAETAECVAEYNGESAFWDFVERAYQQEIPPEVQGAEELTEYVDNASQVASCVESGEATDKVERDIQDAIDATVSGTPTFILYDMEKNESKFVRNPGSAEGFQEVMDEFRERQNR